MPFDLTIYAERRNLPLVSELVRIIDPNDQDMSMPGVFFDQRALPILPCELTNIVDSSDQNIIADSYENPRNLQIVPELIRLASVAEQDLSPELNPTPFPNSDPYVDSLNQNPQDGQSSVPTAQQPYVPCGDRLASDETDTNLVEAKVGNTAPIAPIGLNDYWTTIWVKVGEGSFDLIYQHSIPLGGWSVAAILNTNQESGTPLGSSPFLHGYNYWLIPPDGQLPGEEDITIKIFLADYGGNWDIDSYTFTTRIASSSAKIKNIFLVAKDIVMVNMTIDVINNKYLNDVENYSVKNISGGNDGVVIEVRPTYTLSTASFFIYVKELVLGDTYQLVIKDRSIFDRYGFPVERTLFSWTMKQTKVDMVMRTLANLYNKNVGSTLRSLIEAIMISDEKIGGDF